MLKRCPKCGESKAPGEYGTQSYCRPCHAAYIKARTPRKPRNRPTSEEIRENARARSLRWFRANKERQRAERLALRQERPCEGCEATITVARRADAKYCSEACAMRAARARWIAANAEKHAAAQQRWRDQNREQANRAVSRWAKANPERERLSSIRRRARKHGAYIEDVDRLVVLERHDGVCGICGEDVDPMDYHVDHVVPLVGGGEHSYANSQPAHPACNLRKGHKLEAV